MDAGSLKKRFGKRLRTLRAEKGKTQARLSDDSGVSLEYVSKLERGLASPSFDVITRISKALEVEPAELFAETSFEAGRDTLVQELNHRVKNDFQTIANLLDMAARRAETDKDAEIIKSVRRKTAGFARVHGLLSETGNGEINFAWMAKEIISSLCEIYDQEGLQVVVSTDSLRLTRNQAFLLGLVLNELLVNALRHGVPHAEEPKVMLSLRRNRDKAVMIVADNGPGLPGNYRSPHPVNGLMLVAKIVETNLKGSFKTESDKGATFVVRIPLTAG